MYMRGGGPQPLSSNAQKSQGLCQDSVQKRGRSRVRESSDGDAVRAGSQPLALVVMCWNAPQGGARVWQDISGGDKWQVCVLTPRGSGLSESLHSTPGPLFFRGTRRDG